MIQNEQQMMADPETGKTLDGAKIGRRPKGILERHVREVCDGFVTGKVDFDGKPPTPHRVAEVIEANHPEYPKPTAGAVAAVFERWSKIGAAEIGMTPQQFIGYTTEASELGFSHLYKRYKGQV